MIDRKPHAMSTRYQVVLEGAEFKDGKSFDQTIAEAWRYDEAVEKRLQFIESHPRWKHFSIVIKAVVGC